MKYKIIGPIYYGHCHSDDARRIVGIKDSPADQSRTKSHLTLISYCKDCRHPTHNWTGSYSFGAYCSTQSCHFDQRGF